VILESSWLEIGMGISLLLNLVLGMCVIGIFIKSKIKKPKNSKLAVYISGLAIGFLGGLLGNITITSMFELVKSIFTVPPFYWGGIFVLSFAGTVLIIWKMVSIFHESVGE
jgi:hypothetical protein